MEAVTPMWQPRGPRLEERERIRLIFAEALVLYPEGDALRMWQFVRGFVNFDAPPGSPLVGIDDRRAIHRQ